MSLIISVYVPTGIVISGDSRTTGTLTQQLPNPQQPGQNHNVQTNIVLSDATHKVFKLFDRFGVATFGDAHIGNLPIAHYVQEFEATVQNVPQTTKDLVTTILQYFRNNNPVPKTGFVVAGYDNNTPYVYGVDVFGNTSNRVNIIPQQNTIDYGILRGGDADVVNRLLNNQQRMPPFAAMNLQDAVDFSRHLIRATIDQMRFEPAVQTVGGDIDTLVITRNNTEFLYRKQLSYK